MEPEKELAGPWLVLAAVRLAAELGMLAALAYVALKLAGGHQGVALVLAMVLVAVAATVWGRWVAPRSPARLEDPGRLAVEVVLFGVAVGGLVAGGAWPAAALLAAAYVSSAPVGRRGH